MTILFAARPARLPLPNVESAAVFLAASALVIGYILYMMIRKRKGERPGHQNREPEL